MGFVSHLACTVCGATYPADRVMNLCERDSRPLQIVLDLGAAQGRARSLTAGGIPSGAISGGSAACCRWTSTIPTIAAHVDHAG